MFAYWDRRPLLPLRQGNTSLYYRVVCQQPLAVVCLLAWGNRDDNVPLPKTGWARLESLLEKKWNHQKPEVVRIPASRGCEKKMWFSLDKDIKAVLVKKGDLERVCMITEAASEEYKGLTGHDQMPRLFEEKDGNL